MIKRLKAFFNKEDFIYTSGDVDPFEFHKTFYFMLKAFRVVDHKYLFFNQNIVQFGVVIAITILYFISLLHGLDDFDISYITEAGTFFISLLYMLLILSCTKRNLPQYRNLLETMKMDYFFVCNKGRKYRKKFFNNQLLTWKICLVVCALVTAVSVGMVTFAVIPLFYFLATNTDSTKQRPMPYPIWLHDVDISSSPRYEAVFSFCSIAILLYGYGYAFMIQTQVVWIRHITSKADIIIWSLRDLLTGIHQARNYAEKEYFRKLMQNRLSEIVIHHQSMYRLIDDYASVYKKLLMFEQAFFGPIACLCSYCTALNLENGKINGMFVIMFMGVIAVYFINSYMCTYLSIKVKSVCDACWDIPFWQADKIIRPYLVLIMQRSLRPLPLQAAGFEDISLQTFSKKMAAAYSYFNMLRQLNV